jgi:hypothetical protein
MTEQQVFDSLCHWHGAPLPDKDQARATLLARIQSEPNWVCVLPETLLDKLGIPYDTVFDDKEKALAQAVRGRCVRRFT